MYCVCVDNMLYYRKKERNQEFMAKTGNLYARIEPDVKEQAEEILSTLGISVSSAINMFYRQIIMQRGIPFSMTLPDMSRMTQAELDTELEKGYHDMLAGNVKPSAQVFDAIREGGHP